MRLITHLLSASLPLLAGQRVQLLPAGEFAARDGRPGPGKTWKITDPQGAALAAALNAVIERTPVVIDYEHQTLNAATNGHPAPAAGWMKSVEWLSGKGLVSDVQWTPRAQAAIDAGEYRYISPVITSDEATGQVTGVHLAALTNFPALLGMDAVVAALNTRFTPDPQETDMALLAALIAALGLPATTTEADALANVTQLKATLTTKPVVPEALTTALGLAAGADEVAALAAVTQLKAPAGDTHLVSLVATLQGQVTQLTAELQGDKVTKAVDEAIAAHKLLPAQRDAYIGVGKANFTQLTAILAVAPVIPGLGGQTGDKKLDVAPAGQQTDALSAQVAANLGLTTEQFAKGAPKA